MKKIIGIGNALVDTLATIDNDELLHTFGLPKGSMTLISDEEQQRIQSCFESLNATQATGGSAGNTMLALANLGMRPGFIGAVGNDATGRLFANNCKAKGIEPYLVQLPQQSGIAYTFISPDGERTFATYLGAAAMISPEYLTEEMLHGYDYLYVEGYLVQNHALILRAMELAKQVGVKVCLDLASYNIVEADRDFFRQLVTEYVDIVFANEEEAKSLTGYTPDKALEHIHEMCHIAVVKLGRKGSSAMCDGHKVFAEAMPVKNVVDTTAAGDFYAAGVMYGLMHDCKLEQCAAIGTILAGHVIQTVGTKLDTCVWDKIKLEIKQIIGC